MPEIPLDYVIGMLLCAAGLSAYVVMRVLDKPQDPSTKPRVTDRGASMLREHSDLDTIELRRSKVKPSQRGRSAEDWRSE